MREALNEKCSETRLPQKRTVVLFSAYKNALRNIHALFQAFLPQKAHGYCVHGI
jgi:hypothetical protein